MPSGGGGCWQAGGRPAEGHRDGWGHWPAMLGQEPQGWGNLHPWDSQEEDLNYNQAPTQTPPSANSDLALPDWSPKITLLVLFSDLVRTLREKRWEMKLISVKRRWKAHLMHTWLLLWELLYGRILCNISSKAKHLFYLLSSLQGASSAFLHR